MYLQPVSCQIDIVLQGGALFSTNHWYMQGLSSPHTGLLIKYSCPDFIWPENIHDRVVFFDRILLFLSNEIICSWKNWKITEKCDFVSFIFIGWNVLVALTKITVKRTVYLLDLDLCKSCNWFWTLIWKISTGRVSRV